MTGGRLQARAPYVGDETFCFTYGDGVARRRHRARSIAFHREHGRLATVTAVQPPGRFGALDDRRRRRSRGSRRSRAATAPGSTAASSCSSPASLDYIDGDDDGLGAASRCDGSARDGELGALPAPRASGRRWTRCATSLQLEELWASGHAPWKTWDRRRSAGLTRRACRICGAPLEHVVRATSACRRSPTPTCRRSSAARWSRSTRCTRCVCGELLPRAARGSSRRREHIFARLRLLLLVLDIVARALPRATSRRWSSASASARDEPGRRDRQQRRLPAAVLRRARASRCSASSRRPTSREVAEREGHPDAWSRSSAPRPRGALAPRRAGRPAARQQRARPRARPQRLRRRHEDRCSKPGGVITMEFPHLLRLIEREPVRHDLPRALLATSRS